MQALWFAFYAIWCQRRIVEGIGRVVDKPQVQLGNVSAGEESVDSQQVPGTMSDVIIILAGA